MFSHCKISKYYLLCRCDGSIIQAPSLWEGERTPNINGEERFLRGGLDGVQLSTQDDSLQQHTHGVSDPGHTHGYNDKHINWGNGGVWGPNQRSNGKLAMTHWETTKKVTSNIGVTNVNGDARTSGETRPKNIRVVYIMKVF